MERVDRATVATFFAEGPFAERATVTLGEDAAHHISVRRLAVGDRLALADGAGAIARGTLIRIARGHAVVEVDRVEHRPPPSPVHMLVPVADRERMLLLAEKCVELGASSWRPVLWRRSRSVSPRGEGTTFQAKVRARMASALAQCEGSWLPETYPDATVERAIAATPSSLRVLLDPDAPPLLSLPIAGNVSIAVGPEGGLERAERVDLVAAGFAPASLGSHVLRFETAAVAALAIVRAALALHAPPTTEPHG